MACFLSNPGKSRKLFAARRIARPFSARTFRAPTNAPVQAAPPESDKTQATQVARGAARA